MSLLKHYNQSMKRITQVLPVASCLAVTTATASNLGFTPLQHFPDGNYSLAVQVSGDGSVVVGSSREASNLEAVFWSGSAWDLNKLNPGSVDGMSGNSRAANIDGSVIVGTAPNSTGASSEAFRWTSGTGIVSLGSLSTNGSSYGYGTDHSGSVVVGSSSDPEHFQQAFRWTEGSGMVGLGYLHPDADRSYAYSISGNASVIVGMSENDSGSEAFRWTEDGGMVGLGYLPGGDFSHALGVNIDGSMVVGASKSSLGREAVVWDASGGITSLGFLPGGDFSEATDISGDGSIVVGRAHDQDSEEAFIWDAFNGMRSVREILEEAGFDLAGWDFQGPTYISDDGELIIGTAMSPDSVYQGWVISDYRSSGIVPEPATYAMMLGVLMLGFAIRFRRR